MRACRGNRVALLATMTVFDAVLVISVLGLFPEPCSGRADGARRPGRCESEAPVTAGRRAISVHPGRRMAPCGLVS